MLNVIAGLCFAAFLLAAISLRATERRAQPSSRKRQVSAFVALFLALSFASGLSQRDLWPFAHWPIVSLVVRPYILIPKLVGVDADGREHDLDFRALQPLGLDELSPWLLYNFTRLPEDGQARVMRRLNADIEFPVMIEPEDLMLAMEQQDLEEVVGNLLENAARYARNTVVLRAIPAPDAQDNGDV